MNEIKYIVYFEDKGYYANNQPNYEWSFTDDVNKAKRYKTKTGVLNKIIFASETSFYSNLTPKVFIEEIIHSKNISTSQIIGELNINDEMTIFENNKNKKRIEKFKKKYGEETLKIINEPLKVKVDKISTDDDFWD